MLYVLIATQVCIACVLKTFFFSVGVLGFLPPNGGMYMDSLNRNPAKCSVICEVPCFSLLSSNMKRMVSFTL